MNDILYAEQYYPVLSQSNSLLLILWYILAVSWEPEPMPRPSRSRRFLTWTIPTRDKKVSS